MSHRESVSSPDEHRPVLITPVMRAAAVAGLLGQVVLIVGSWTATWLQDGRYDVARDDLSDLDAIGAPYAWVSLFSEAVCGIATVAFVWLALRPALSGVRGRTQTAVLLTLTWGLGTLSSAFFRLDCRTADGCTPEQKVQSWHAVVHVATTPLLLVLAIVPYLVARCLRRSPTWSPFAGPSLMFGVALDVVLVAGIALDSHWGAGYAQRLLALAAVWIALLAASVIRVGHHSCQKDPTESLVRNL